jgi:LPXTG-site transpeptidase (sortase) family protein
MVKTRRKIFIATLVTSLAFVVFVGTFVRSVAYYPEAEVPLPESAQTISGGENVPVGLAATVSATEYPVRLSIPSLKIDTKVQNVGVARSGNMAPPTNFTDVGWYKYGTVPGYRGSAVFAGHVDNALALAGVFKNLEKIRVGEAIHVTNAEGEVLKFRVTDMRLYDYNNVPTDQIFNQNDRARIRLITCSGCCNQSLKSNHKRLVVTAELVT